VSADAALAIQSALEASGVLFFDNSHPPPKGGVGVRLTQGIIKTAAVSPDDRHLRGKTIISTQQQWEEARPASGGDKSMRAFLRKFGFDPNARIELAAGKARNEEFKPRNGTIRRDIFEQCLIPGSSVQEINKTARMIGGTSVRMDADLFIGLFVGHVRLP
jgi:hypothetical protein